MLQYVCAWSFCLASPGHLLAFLGVCVLWNVIKMNVFKHLIKKIGPRMKKDVGFVCSELNMHFNSKQPYDLLVGCWGSWGMEAVVQDWCLQLMLAALYLRRKASEAVWWHWKGLTGGSSEVAPFLDGRSQVGRDLQRSPVQPPLKAEIRWGSSGLYPAGSQKLPRMDLLGPPAPWLDHPHKAKHLPGLVPQTQAQCCYWGGLWGWIFHLHFLTDVFPCE